MLHLYGEKRPSTIVTS